MSEWLNTVLSRAQSVDDWLSPKREQSLALLRDAKWPNRKTEAWKYTPLRAVENAQFAAPADVEAAVTAIAGLESIDLVFINGRFAAEQSTANLPQGLHITQLADVSEADKTWALQAFAAIKPSRHLFGLVNDALATEGVIIDVAASAKITAPVRIVNQLSENAEAHNRVLVRVAQQASLTVVEQTIGDAYSFNTAFAEYDIADDASLEHYRFALQTDKAMSVGGSHFQLANRSQLNSTLVGFGSSLSRLDVDVTHGGEHAFAKLNAIYLLDGEELFDLHSTIEHAQPHGTTEENVRGIVGDSATAVFNGRIHIHRDAQKTLAELNNRNLLMSNKAVINTKPELEIYADDVRCAHGATIAEIDKKALYYMQSRGVDRAQAQVMLNFGFINELVDQMPNAALAEWLRPQLRQRFAKMEVN
ncbi:Fe-S cluster assembly protein SufD [Dasania sp. GY-MA-18]|uniref:Fe-S cluster assembly protein SufD n=1 Tax=Dasania phycosphaerae TaxID=2950436 RepID=A0A9J6RRX4_9GAMM|nr:MULTISPECIES: Fe-S cluster assembly protein SufD [Dasania]MCR8924176.1 Fe-S cluster assembly protein SufD [Dasania sp. GY-MA-18]MCZ0866829.1 Fe-S cluster assembly protein SufD [Dasania phycosphaerae]MCZ0870334.1 Fe-S cluster assembly protein SufD [Dasania phycosphaerae]